MPRNPIQYDERALARAARYVAEHNPRWKDDFTGLVAHMRRDAERLLEQDGYGYVAIFGYVITVCPLGGDDSRPWCRASVDPWHD